MFTTADIEAEYLDALSTITPKQLWAMQLYGAACALVALERGSFIAGTPDEHQVAREALFHAEAVRRNAKTRIRQGDMAVAEAESGGVAQRQRH